MRGVKNSGELKEESKKMNDEVVFDVEEFKKCRKGERYGEWRERVFEYLPSTSDSETDEDEIKEVCEVKYD